jgi:hypothetical protein
MSPYIPQRVKRAKQQITIKLYQDRLAMLDQYGCFIEDSRDYIIDQALDLVFKKDKDFLQWLEHKSRVEQGLDATADPQSAPLPFRLQTEEGAPKSDRGREFLAEPTTPRSPGKFPR